eukprot:Gb_34756 [translate_table: standard]
MLTKPHFIKELVEHWQIQCIEKKETQSVYNLLVLAVGTLAFSGLFCPGFSMLTGNTHQALATKYSSISTRRLTKSLQILTRDKDNGGHKRLRWRAPHAQEAHTRISSGSCSSAQVGCGTEAKPFRSKRYEERIGYGNISKIVSFRDNMMKGLIKSMYSEFKGQCGVVNVSEQFLKALFPFALKQVMGRDVECAYVEELGATLSKWEMHSVLITEFIKGAINVDWRDFFPYLRWIPNRSFECRVMDVERKRTTIMKANYYPDILLTEAKYLTKKQFEMAIWESIIESVDIVLVTWEWIMFELDKISNFQPHLCARTAIQGGEVGVWGKGYDRGRPAKLDIHERNVLGDLKKASSSAHSATMLCASQHGNWGLLHPYRMPAMNIYGCHREETEWKEVKRWNPEKHLSEGVKEELIDVTRRMTFEGGRRMCAGVQQAMVIVCTPVGRTI